MSELIKRQDAIDAVAKAYRYESDRMTALQKIPTVTEEEIREKAMMECRNDYYIAVAISGKYNFILLKKEWLGHSFLFIQ